MKRILALLLVMLLLGACAGQAVEGGTTTEPTTASVPNKITVISNREEYEAHVQLMNSGTHEDGRFLYADGGLLLVDTEALSEIAYADDFQIVLSGYATSVISIRCALYNNDYTSIYALYEQEPWSLDSFSFPDEAGLYLLSVETFWERGEEYARFIHVFKIRR